MPEILINVRGKLPLLAGDVRSIVTKNTDYIIRFDFDAQWDDGEKTVYFVRSNGYVFPPTRTVNNTVIVPEQHAAGKMTRLFIGVQQGDVKTSRSCELPVYAAVTELIDDSAVMPEPEVWESFSKRISLVEDALSAGEINKIVEAYMEANPVIETDPTVPDWAKQPDKPKYTADEVGALPASTQIPGKTSELTNDSGFITRIVSDLANYFTKNQTYSREEVDARLSAIPKFSISVVSSLPTSGINEGTVYLVKAGSASGDMYTEYIRANGAWEILGSQRVDLTGYATEAWVNLQLADYLTADKLTAAIITGALGYVPANRKEIPSVPVQSVNGKVGAVKLDADDVGARPDTWMPTATDVGALPVTTKIPAATSDLTNDSGYITIAVATLLNYYLKTETYAKTETYSQTEVDNLISGLDKRLNAIADSEDVDLDQLSEIVAYIKANKSLIDSITTDKVNVSDIVDNLTTADSKKPLSAAQGKALKALYDALPAWAKAASKPTYTKFEVGLGNVDNVRQYSASNPPPYPVTSVNGKTGAVTVTADSIGSATKEQVEQISKEIADETTAREQAVADLNARLGQQTLLIAEGETLEEALVWLETNGDKTKAYLMPDDFFYMWKKTTEVGGAAYKNVLPLATDTDRTTIYGEDYNGDGVNDGYIKGQRLSSSGGTAALDTACASGFIFPVTVGDVVRIKNIIPIQGSSSQYVVSYDASNTKVASPALARKDDYSDWITNSPVYTYADGILTIPITEERFGTGFDAIRFSAGTINENTIVTINEEIVEGTGTVIIEKWASTGHSLTQTDYSNAIAQLIIITDTHTAEINELREAIESGNIGTDEDPLTVIRNWDAPIYDRVPVFQLDAEKAAITSADKTVDAIYAKYDALMADNPRYITKTDLGLCSDGVTHVYRYDFCEPESRHNSGFEWSETKPKFIVITGIHREYGGIYAMYNALAEITTNSELAELRRSVHFIVVPVVSPYSLLGDYSITGHSLNANGVEIHRNFEVGFKVTGEGTIHYTGTEPLSEVETQYIDNIFKNNSDAAYFLSCHSFDRDYTWGTGFLWGSTGTKYMCNMIFRVIDKMGKAWHEKYGSAWEEGIARENAYVLANPDKCPNAKALEEGDYRIGHAGLTNTNGAEQRQATKYGIQAINFEICDYFRVLDDTALSAKAMTHGAEAYINFFLTAMDCYDFKDKAEYFKG